MQGKILDIKRLSVHDGPGIRTTVFMKGCSLNCRWCHNPESISAAPEIGLLQSRCVLCGECAAVCPAGAHTVTADKHVFNHELCNACGKCVEACLPGALEFYGHSLAARDVATAILEDKTFYDKSGGGATVSGGEPLLQAEFCAELFQLLHASGINCAVDTSGAVPWSKFETVLPAADMFLYDVKHVDDSIHNEHTGSACRLIRENLRRLSQCGMPIEIRIPIVPGFNADSKSINAIGDFLSGINNLTGVRLLPYHVAHSKYKTVGRTDNMPQLVPPSPEALRSMEKILAEYNLNILK